MGQTGACQPALWRLLALYVGSERLCSCQDFSNTLSKTQIEEMATVDEFEVVKEVQVGAGKRGELIRRSTLRITWHSILRISR